MQRRNIDFEIPLTRELWDQLGQAANLRPDFGVMRWSPAEPDFIQLSIREDDRPDGWDTITPPLDDMAPEDREVARFVYNDGRPYARLEPPSQPTPPADLPHDDQRLEQSLERWVRSKWHEMLRDSGIHYDRGALPAAEPNPPTR
jgi:hypothetical protein